MLEAVEIAMRRSKKENEINSGAAIACSLLDQVKRDGRSLVIKAVTEGALASSNDSSASNTSSSSSSSSSSYNGGTLLHLASFFGQCQVVQLLLSLGASSNLQHSDEDCTTPLHLAANDLVAELLLSAGANANALGKDGETPLHHACRRGDEKTVDMLLRVGGRSGGDNGHDLQSGIQINARDNMGRTPLSEAVRCAPMVDGEEKRRYLRVTSMLARHDEFTRGPADRLAVVVKEKETKILNLENIVREMENVAKRKREENERREEELKKSSMAVLDMMETLMMSSKKLKKEILVECVVHYQEMMEEKRKEMVVAARVEEERLLEEEKRTGIVRKKRQRKKKSGGGGEGDGGEESKMGGSKEEGEGEKKETDNEEDGNEEEESQIKWPGVIEMSVETTFVSREILNEKKMVKKPKMKSKKVYEKEYQEKCRVAAVKTNERLRRLIVESSIGK